MEEQMRNIDQDKTGVTARRSFFGRIAAMSALGLFGFATSTARGQAAPHADMHRLLRFAEALRACREIRSSEYLIPTPLFRVRHHRAEYANPDYMNARCSFNRYRGGG